MKKENEEFDFYLTGIIKGKPKEQNEKIDNMEEKEKKEQKDSKDSKYSKETLKQKEIEEDNISIIKEIKDDIRNKFENNPDFYIYLRHNKQKHILRIFVVLLQNTKSNDKNIDITYLITIKVDEFPILPPMVFCLTEFNFALDIFDFRNIQSSLIPEWSKDYKIGDLISEIPSFTQAFDYQVNNGLLPMIGTYSINSYIYDINDFMLNPNNLFFKISVPIISDDNINKGKLEDKYMIITQTKFILLQSADQKSKNQCIINYVGELIGIDKVKRFSREQKGYEHLSCLKIIWNNHIKNGYTGIICGEQSKLIIKDITDNLIKRRDELNHSFFLFESNEDNDISQNERIIKIKEKIIKNGINEGICDQIQKTYKKIIEEIKKSNEGSVEKTMEKFQKFLELYDKIKSEEIDKKIKAITEANFNLNVG